MVKRRCPECGYLTAERECPICMVRIPGSAAPKAVSTAPGRTGTYTPPRRRTKKKTGPLKAVLLTLLVIFWLFGTAMEYGMFDSVGSEIDDLLSQVERVEWETQMVVHDDLDYEWKGRIPRVEETVIWDGNGITVTANELTLEWGDPCLWLTVDNHSGRDVTVSSDPVAVNGYMLDDSGFFTKAEDGETVMEPMYLYADELNALEINAIGEIGFFLYCYDSVTYDSLIGTQWITLATSDGGKGTAGEFSGRELLDYQGVRVEFLDAAVENGDGAIRFYIENNGTRPIALCGEDMSINGRYSEEGWLFTQLPVGYRTVYTVELYLLEELDVEATEDMKEMTVSLDLMDNDTWDILLEDVQVTFELGGGA